MKTAVPPVRLENYEIITCAVRTIKRDIPEERKKSAKDRVEIPIGRIKPNRQIIHALS